MPERKRYAEQKKGGIEVILIDYKDSRPIYEQVYDKFRLLILNGALKSDEKMPSVRTLAMELSINPNTIQRAYGELERTGYIYTVKGRGNFVSDTEGLKQEYRREVFGRLDEVCDSARKAGVTVDEIIGHIREYDSGEGHVRGYDRPEGHIKAYSSPRSVNNDLEEEGDNNEQDIKGNGGEQP